MFVVVLSILLLIFVFQAATILVLEFRRPAHATAWLFILFLFPFMGFILYYFLAQEYRRSRKVKRSRTWESKRHQKMLSLSSLLAKPSDLPAPGFLEQNRLFRGLVKNGEIPILGTNKAEIYSNGIPTYEAMLIAIRAAKHHIHISSYIVRDDDTGRKFQKALIEKVKQGVAVRFLYDGVGSITLKESYVKMLTNSGVKIACFFPLKLSFLKKTMNYRNHRKIIVVDGLVGFIGGINIGDEYIGKHPRLGYWRDTHLKLEGDSVYRLQEVFLKDWEIATGEKLDEPAFMPEHRCQSHEPIQIVPAGPNRRGDAIHDSVYAMLTAARKRIWITTPYFIPSASVAMALHDAALSGLDVRILIPDEPDTWIVHYASLSYVEEMMKSGVRVWKYRKGFVHAKTIIVDELMGVVGSANMDLRSFFSNFEINAHLFDPSAIARLESDFLQDLEDSSEIILEEFHNRPQLMKIKEALSRIFSPLL